VKENGKLMEQAQRLTRDLRGRQEELARREVEAQAGAGLVTAVMNGRGDLLRVRIDPKMFARVAGDQSLIEDVIVAAVNAALVEVRKLQQSELSSLTAPFGGIPGLAFDPSPPPASPDEGSEGRGSGGKST